MTQEAMKNTPRDAALRSEIQERLRSLSYRAFEAVVARLMAELGYMDVAADRSRFRGRNAGGGVDLAATTRTGVTEARVVAQLKHFSRPVQMRSVDEARGAALRCGARQAIIFTVGTFSPPARSAAASGQVVPVRLIDGEELAALLVRHRIGTDGDGRMDPAFFDGLAEEFPKTAGDDLRRISRHAARTQIEIVIVAREEA
jgi:restriction endonuclease Mrr